MAYKMKPSSQSVDFYMYVEINQFGNWTGKLSG